MSDWLNRVHFGDCLETLRRMPDGIVNTCVTSPPYFGLRDYGHPGQIGLEASPEEFVQRLVEVFREVRRVLRDDGTCWVNMGDSYAGSWGNQGRKEERGTQRPINGGMLTPVHDGRYPDAGSNTGRIRMDGVKPKDLYGIPWMLAFALRADGWYLRQDIIWAKPNPMPESVTDRCTKSHEYIFLLSKSPRYYYDADAVKERATESSEARWAQDVEQQAGSDRVPGKTNGTMKAAGGPRSKRDSFKRDYSKRAEVIPGQSVGTHRANRDESEWDTSMRNKRSVWTVSTKPYSGAHFATFPEDLIEPCILAGTSARGVCPHCHSQWARQTGRPCEQCDAFIATQGKSCAECGHVRDWKAERGISEELNATEWSKPGKSVPRKLGASGKQGAVPPQELLIGDWAPTCDCQPHVPVRAVVLDPFMGSGTTAAVATRLGRDFIGCELNPEYESLQRERLAGQTLGLELA